MLLLRRFLRDFHGEAPPGHGRGRVGDELLRPVGGHNVFAQIIGIYLQRIALLDNAREGKEGVQVLVPLQRLQQFSRPAEQRGLDLRLR